MITVLTGTNTFAISQKLKQLTRDFIKDHGTEGVERYEADQIDVGQLGSLLGGATLFASNRFVVIKNMANQKLLAEAFLTQLNSIPDEVVVVLVEPQLDKRTAFYKSLKKHTHIIEHGEMDSYTASKWVREYTASEGGSITPEVAALLVMHVGTNQLQLKNEVEKLVSWNPEISKESIHILVEKTPQDSVFELLEHALSGNKKSALGMLDSMERAHQDVFQIANMLIWQTHILALIYSAGSLSEHEISSDTKINPYVVKKTKKLTHRLTKQSLRTIIKAVSDCDVQLKTTSVDPWRVVEQTILAFSLN